VCGGQDEWKILNLNVPGRFRWWWEPAVRPHYACGPQRFSNTFDLRSQITLKEEFFIDVGNFARIFKFCEQCLICNKICACCVDNRLFHPSYSFSSNYPDFIFCGFAVQRGLWPPRSRGFLITHNDAPHSVGLLWMSDHLFAETST
jgi:hypothetical protein